MAQEISNGRHSYIRASRELVPEHAWYDKYKILNVDINVSIYESKVVEGKNPRGSNPRKEKKENHTTPKQETVHIKPTIIKDLSASSQTFLPFDF